MLAGLGKLVGKSADESSSFSLILALVLSSPASYPVILLCSSLLTSELLLTMEPVIRSLSFIFHGLVDKLDHRVCLALVFSNTCGLKVADSPPVERQSRGRITFVMFVPIFEN